MSFPNRQDNTVILAYHHICNFWHPTIARVSPKSFKTQIKYLQQAEFSVPTLSEYFNRSFDNLHKKSVLLTFDDGLRCFYKNAYEILLERKMRATIFVVTNFIDRRGSWDYYDSSGKCRHLNWSELKELCNQGFEIGSHSCSHIDLKPSPSKKIVNELEVSKKTLEDRLGVAVNFFSYPFGRLNKKIEELCLQVGYTGAVTMNPGVVNGNLFGLNRKAVYLFESDRQFHFKLNQASSMTEKIKLKAINTFSMGTIILNNLKNPVKST